MFRSPVNSYTATYSRKYNGKRRHRCPYGIQSDAALNAELRALERIKQEQQAEETDSTSEK